MLRSITQTDATQTVVLAGGASITGSIRHLYPRAARRALCARAREYLSSFPGASNLSINIGLHNAINQLLDLANEVHKDRLEWISKKLEYRLDIMRRATEFGYRLGSTKKCREWDWIAYKHKNEKVYSTMISLVRRTKPFELPIEGEGWSFEKGNHFVAMVCFELFDSVDEAKARLLILKRSVAPGKVARSVEEFMKYPRIQKSLEAISQDIQRPINRSS